MSDTTRAGWRAAADDLPIGEAIEPLLAALDNGKRAVLQAPPGAGKTTIVPLALLDEDWCTGTIVLLEPRRLAVRAAATRMAYLIGERPGGTIGWRMRQDTKVSAATRIEVVTEGILTRRLQRDPELAGVSAVVFDEFHERSLDADVGLAFTLEAAGALRDDLRIVVMSATLDAAPVADLLGAPVITSEGRIHPVDLVHVDVDRRGRTEPAVAATVRRALAEHDGDVLVFLPGAAEIQRTHGALGDLGPGIDVRPLYGALPPAAQDAAIAPSPAGRRKVVLATSIAETSLTIEGVTVVVDAGWRRTPRLDAGTGLTALVTLPVTRAEADQRAGRAGRVRPGTAYRLWGAADHATLRAHPEPEIAVTDLTGLALDLAAWGADADDLAWLDRPPAAHLAAARDLLGTLGALDGDVVTAHGRAMAELPVHPRLAHLLLRSAELGHGATAADVAAVLHESGFRGRNTDLDARLDALRRPRDRDRAAAERARSDARRFRRLIGVPDGARPDRDAAGLVASLGFPDRVGRRREGQRGEFLLVNGRGAFCDEADPLADVEYLCALELDGRGRRSRLYLGVPLGEDDVRTVAGARISTHTEVRWDARQGDVVAEHRETFGAVTLVAAPVRADDVEPEAFRQALLDGIALDVAGLLAWTDDHRRLQARLQFLHRHRSDEWPAVDDDTLVAEAPDRIGPYLSGMRRRRDLRRVDVAQILTGRLDWQQRLDLDRLAPERIEVPSGNRHRVDYSVDPPVLAVKLQEMFGAAASPAVLDGEVPVVLHLLSPAGRPLQVTQDLASFWANAYAQVRADMRGRYPKHPWPEDPATATPTARTKRRSSP